MPFWVVEIAGLEPATYTLRTYRATSCAISPNILQDKSVNPAVLVGTNGLRCICAIAQVVVPICPNPCGLVGTNGLEPSTSCMSSKRSDQLSYAPE